MANKFASFMRRKGVDHEIDFGEEKVTYKFHPISVKRFSSLQDVVKVLGRSITVLCSQGSSYRSVSRTYPEGSEVTTEPAEPDVLQKNHDIRTQAIEDLATVLLHETNVRTTVGLIVDSLRDDFEPDDAREFLECLDAELLPQFLEGLAKANKKVFDPLAKGLGIDLNLIGVRLRERLDSELPKRNEESDYSPVSEQQQEPQETARVNPLRILDEAAERPEPEPVPDAKPTDR